MKTRSILLATLLSVGALQVGVTSALAAEPAAASITTKAAATQEAGDTSAKAAATAADLQNTGASFVQRVNYARVALAMNNVPLAKQHITDAQRLLASIRASNPEQLRLTKVGAGRVTYKDNEGKFYYPIETGPIVVEQTKQGSILNRNSLAVTDAEIAYVTLDFRDNEADKLLAKALQNIDGDDLKDAQADLGKLMDKVIDTKDAAISVPLDRARDNIALARSFITMENYDGARFSLKHADKALDEMEKDKTYAQHRTAVGTLRKEVAMLQTAVKQNDPSAWAKADDKLKQWWTDLKGWARD